MFNIFGPNTRWILIAEKTVCWFRQQEFWKVQKLQRGHKFNKHLKKIKLDKVAHPAPANFTTDTEQHLLGYISKIF